MNSKYYYNGYVASSCSAKLTRKARDNSSDSASRVNNAASNIVNASKVKGISNVAGKLNAISRNRYGRIESIAGYGDYLKNLYYERYKSELAREREERRIKLAREREEAERRRVNGD